MREARSTRGVPPPRSPSEEKRLLQFYEALLPEGSDHEDSDFRPPPDLPPLQRRKDMITLNIQAFPFLRRHHTEIDIATLPRVHSSYALLDETALYRPNPLLNRKLVGLPRRQPTEPSHDKNVCHEKLFEIQDEKLDLDRRISRTRQLLAATNLDYHRQKLAFLLQVKADKQQQWLARDRLYFIQSLDQRYWQARHEQYQWLTAQVSALEDEPWTSVLRSKSQVWSEQYCNQFAKQKLVCLSTFPSNLQYVEFQWRPFERVCQWATGSQDYPYLVLDFTARKALLLLRDVLTSYSRKLATKQTILQNLGLFLGWAFQVPLTEFQRQKADLNWGPQRPIPVPQPIILKGKPSKTQTMSLSRVQQLVYLYRLYQRCQTLLAQGAVHQQNYSAFVYNASRPNIFFVERGMFLGLGERRYRYANWSRVVRQCCAQLQRSDGGGTVQVCVQDGVVYCRQVVDEEQWQDVLPLQDWGPQDSL